MASKAHTCKEGYGWAIIFLAGQERKMITAIRLCPSVTPVHFKGGTKVARFLDCGVITPGSKGRGGP
jgi:hypothetical protein